MGEAKRTCNKETGSASLLPLTELPIMTGIQLLKHMYHSHQCGACNNNP